MAAPAGGGKAKVATEPTPEELAKATAQEFAEGFVETLRAHYEAANLAEVAALYRDDSTLVVDGVAATGVAAIGGLIMPRFESGPVYIKWLSVDGQQTPSNDLAVLTTGDSSVPMCRFTEFFLLGFDGAKWYIKVQVLRFGEGSTPFNTAADATGVGLGFATNYYRMYAADRMSVGVVYRDVTQLTCEGVTVFHLAGIAEKLRDGMPTGSHEQQTLDVVPTTTGSMILVVTGLITLTGEANKLQFSHCFLLETDAEGPFVTNEVFRFVYG